MRQMKAGKVLPLASLDTNIVLSHTLLLMKCNVSPVESESQRAKLLNSIDHELTGRSSRLIYLF